jgi:hypothetical protein
MNILRPFKNRQKEILRVEKVKISRAVFEDSDSQRIDVKLKVEGDNILLLECSPDVARDIILQMTASYEAIRPTLATGRYQSTWQGMDN